MTLRFTLASFARPRAFTIRDGGRVLVRGRAAGAAVPVSFRVRVAPGVAHYRITTPTDPDSIGAIMHTTDARSVSLQISDIDLRDVTPVAGA
jgi:hypothetical protein